MKSYQSADNQEGVVYSLVALQGLINALMSLDRTS